MTPIIYCISDFNAATKSAVAILETCYEGVYNFQFIKQYSIIVWCDHEQYTN